MTLPSGPERNTPPGDASTSSLRSEWVMPMSPTASVEAAGKATTSRSECMPGTGSGLSVTAIYGDLPRSASMPAPTRKSARGRRGVPAARHPPCRLVIAVEEHGGALQRMLAGLSRDAETNADFTALPPCRASKEQAADPMLQDDAAVFGKILDDAQPGAAERQVQKLAVEGAPTRRQGHGRLGIRRVAFPLAAIAVPCLIVGCRHGHLHNLLPLLQSRRAHQAGSIGVRWLMEDRKSVG